MRTADRITAVVLLLLGIGMAVGGLTMERLEIRRIHPGSIPGLVPMILGVMLALCAVLLFFSKPVADPEVGADANTDSRQTSEGRVNLAVTALWSVIYALGMLGRLPFTLATAIYIAGFVAWFGWPRAEAASVSGAARIRSIVIAVVLAAVSAILIATLFSKGFYVRLP